MSCYAGIDIGGTKCAVVLGQLTGERIEVLSKEKFPTEGGPHEMLAVLGDSLERQLGALGSRSGALKGVGISCGGPLDSRTGTILSPPNLPGWDRVPVTEYFRSRFQVEAVLENDANACAVAEWRFGAGRGTENMIFLTFGTGFGGGLILNGRLYRGACDMAGEIGHVRAAPKGPVGYGKAGSFEGFCSGGGIARLGRDLKQETAKDIAEGALAGDEDCREVYRQSGEKLGECLSILVDLLNPDAIVIGSIFARSKELLWEPCRRVMERECLPQAYERCRVLASELGDEVGDIAALSIIVDRVQRRGEVQ